jgi:hypothetical protein
MVGDIRRQRECESKDIAEGRTFRAGSLDDGYLSRQCYVLASKATAARELPPVVGLTLNRWNVRAFKMHTDHLNRTFVIFFIKTACPRFTTASSGLADSPNNFVSQILLISNFVF